MRQIGPRTRSRYGQHQRSSTVPADAHPRASAFDNGALVRYNEHSRGCSSGVERLLPKQNVVGSNPITRSFR